VLESGVDEERKLIRKRLCRGREDMLFELAHAYNIAQLYGLLESCLNIKQISKESIVPIRSLLQLTLWVVGLTAIRDGVDQAKRRTTQSATTLDACCELKCQSTPK